MTSFQRPIVYKNNEKNATFCKNGMAVGRGGSGVELGSKPIIMKGKYD